MTCNSCGGIIGRDCFNPQECQWITDNINQQNAMDVETLRHELTLANNTILSLQLANESLQIELKQLKQLNR